jgi:glycosyltransferase involved in cell wall biosynthesis
MAQAVASVNTADFEGMPNVLLEGWSRGVPALALNHDPGGVITGSGLGGFAQGSATALTGLARDLWCERAHSEQLARRCRDYVEAHHSPATTAARWEAVLWLSAHSRQTVAPRVHAHG